MTSNPLMVVAVTVVLIVLSAFFVAVEFALLGARRHRLEELAPTSRAARAALRSHGELTVLLAGSQLGITACALGLGAVTKPALDYALRPLLADIGAPGWLATAAAFAIALVVVTFLHLVIGEMAPKSWAIAHPETAATMLAIPMRGFMWVFRPVLVFLNEAANWLLRRVGVTPQESVSSGQDPSDLRQLIEHSANVGALDPAFSAHLTETLDLQNLTLGELVDVRRVATAVAADATVADVRRVARDSGHLRVLVADPAGGAGRYAGFVHVRDTLPEPDERRADTMLRPLPTLAGDTPVYEAVRQMREARAHLVLVSTAEGTGVITLSDVLTRLFPHPVEEDAEVETARA
ncbi:hemolysin family protein [Nocardioides lentus]|uniref:Hemolysin family protein n=1 Tax=Nocardioides lentus TaxID=338077 RepID=A0ABP5B505_9ACTN